MGSVEEAVPSLTNGGNDPLVAASADLNRLYGIRQAQVRGDPDGLAAVTQEQLGDAGHGVHL